MRNRLASAGWLGIAVALAAGAACAQQQRSESGPGGVRVVQQKSGGAVVQNDSAEPAESALAERDNRFGLGMLQRMAAADPDRNVTFSPTSAEMALQMLLNGAEGPTRAAIGAATSVDGMPLAQVNSANAALLKRLTNGQSGVTLDIANGLWTSDRAGPVKQAFLDALRQEYRAEVGDLSGAPQNINQWVAEKTREKIQSLVGESDVARAVAVLANAVYFKGMWAEKFDKKQTESWVFHTAAGERRDVQMMRQSGEYQYMDGGDFQMVKLPYTSGSMAAYFLLPSEKLGLPALLNRWSVEHWAQWRRDMSARQGQIGVPRFRLEGTIDLQPPLAAMGMGQVFQPGAADLSGIAGQPGDLWIGRAVQKTFVEMNEEGTEAAAATGLVVMTRAVRVQEPPFKMILDRPFLWAIVDERTGAMLFAGAVEDTAE